MALMNYFLCLLLFFPVHSIYFALSVILSCMQLSITCSGLAHLWTIYNLRQRICEKTVKLSQISEKLHSTAYLLNAYSVPSTELQRNLLAHMELTLTRGSPVPSPTHWGGASPQLGSLAPNPCIQGFVAQQRKYLRGSEFL